MRLNPNRIIHKTKKDYNRIAELFSCTRSYLWKELSQFEKYVKDGQNIFDWGCGNGRMLNLLKKRDVRYFGFDQSDELIKIAKEKWKAESGRAKFYSVNRKFPDNFFDVVFLIASFNHLPDKKTRVDLLKKLRLQMKSGGVIIITVWNLRSDWAVSKSEDWEEISKDEFIIPWRNSNREILCERYYHSFSSEELRELLLSAGFKIKNIFYDDEKLKVGVKNGRNLIAVAYK
jgi:ubiquinone/menaquinone biosynthesis C-methylase UbiE